MPMGGTNKDTMRESCLYSRWIRLEETNAVKIWGGTVNLLRFGGGKF